MALTATATPRVRADVVSFATCGVCNVSMNPHIISHFHTQVKQLGMSDTKWFLTSFNRGNLQYEVHAKKGKTTCMNEITAMIKK